MMNWNRLLDLIDRYIAVQEKTLALNEARAASIGERERLLSALDERVTAAQEKVVSEGIRMRGDVIQRHRVPIPELPNKDTP